MVREEAALLAMEPRPGGPRPSLTPLAQTVADEATAGHTRLLQAPADASPGELLDAVARELGSELRVAHLAGAGGTPEALAAAALEAATGVSPEAPLFAFEAYLAHLRSTGRGLVLLIDDVTALPPKTQRWLRARIAAADGALRVVAAAADGGAAVAAARGFGLAVAVPATPAPTAPVERTQPAVVAIVGLVALALGVLAWGALW
jgi:hypothetical protein